MIHSLLAIFFILCVVGLILWGIGQIPGIPQPVKVVVYVLAGLYLLYYVWGMLNGHAAVVIR